MKKIFVLFFTFLFINSIAHSQLLTQETTYLLKPTLIFDGITQDLHKGWVVLIRGNKIEAVGPKESIKIPESTKVINLVNMTLMPGLIDVHSHIFLHPYTETPWHDQVSYESQSLRVARAINHLRDTLLAGFTTLRDLGTEGAGYADVGLKRLYLKALL